jgi:hypothetical protein
MLAFFLNAIRGLDEFTSRVVTSIEISEKFLRMKVLVQDRHSQRFLGVKGKWIANHEQAINFEGILRAAEAVWEYGLKQVRVLLRKEDGKVAVLLELSSPA